MSVDYMLVKTIEADQPIGRLDDVVDEARRVLGVDLTDDTIAIDGVELLISPGLDDENLMVLHVSPGDAEDGHAAMRTLARAIGAVVFDCQSGQELGVEPPRVPDGAIADYELHFVHPLIDSMGRRDEVWARLEEILGATEAHPQLVRDGWTLRVEKLVSWDLPSEQAAQVVLRAGWQSAAAREALFAAVVAAAKDAGWVPFDPNRNDTLD